jgi:hypothetical protein
MPTFTLNPLNELKNTEKKNSKSELENNNKNRSHQCPTSAAVKKTWIYIYIHSSIRLHGALLN